MKPNRHLSTTRAQALPAPATLHPMVLWALMLATLLLMSIPRLVGAQDLLANARTQYQAAAYDSMVWFENAREYMHLSPLELAYTLMTRSGRVTYEDLKRRDAKFAADYANKRG